MLNDVYAELKASNEETLQGLGRELGKLRTGRASLGMLDGVRVEYYGQVVPLNQVAALKTPDPRLITITPWEKPMIGIIEKAISAAGLGFNPSNDGVMIRIPIPPLTGDRRQELTKVARKIGEDHKISLRTARRDANDTIKELEKESEITEDDMHRALSTVDDITSNFTNKVDEIVKAKEVDIMEI